MAKPDKQVVVYGAGGHGRVLLEALRLVSGNLALWMVDDDKQLHGSTFGGLAVHPVEHLVRAEPSDFEIANGVGSAGLPEARRSIFEKMTEIGFDFATVVHPSAIVSPSVSIASGVQLMAGCVLQANTSIGFNTLVNTRAAIDHDCVIGDHCHLAPGVTLSGGVSVGSYSHLGTGACVIQGITIGAGSFIAAGAVVTGDLPPGSHVRGVPAKPRG